MTEQIYQWLETIGWTKEMIEESWSGNYIYNLPISRGQVIINGQPVQQKPEYVKVLISYEGDSWIQDQDNTIDCTQWKIEMGEQIHESFIVDSLEQFQSFLQFYLKS